MAKNKEEYYKIIAGPLGAGVSAHISVEIRLALSLCRGMTLTVAALPRRVRVSAESAVAPTRVVYDLR